jgi:hypothetical protein
MRQITYMAYYDMGVERESISKLWPKPIIEDNAHYQLSLSKQDSHEPIDILSWPYPICREISLSLAMSPRNEHSQ